MKQFYLQDGEILKKEKKTDKIEINKNIEMIKYAKWDGELNNQNMKCGNWQAFWKGKKLGIGGYYDQCNLKTGKWVEFFNQYWEQITLSILQVGVKLFSQENTKMERNSVFGKHSIDTNKGNYFKQCLCTYDKDGLQQGRSFEVSEQFWDLCQVFEFGVYRDGKKVGRWEIQSKQSIILGGGNYNQKGLKDGRWVELESNFWKYFQLRVIRQNQVIQIGDYQNGIKIGFWKIQFKMTELFDYQDMYKNFLKYNRGGGSYLNDKKIGRWKEIHDNFHNQCQVIYAGEYFNGVKIGQWNTLYKGIRQDEYINMYYIMITILIEEEANILMEKKQNNGQIYILISKSIVALSYLSQCQVFQTGVYEEGLKQGQWKILFRINNQENHQNMQIINQNQRGTGYYENGLQIGKSCELHQIYFNNYQFVWTGEYTKGNKNGWWDIIWRNKSNDNQEKIIGGGTYVKGLKNGLWTDLVENFSSQSWQEKVLVGEYVNGEKPGGFKIQQII
ncbi:unnamed protein product (macronuclear) [Paramecium tetraurelia]|uniref:Uncharacterized protein n=1 Tax=Paramecium tetraurelia TaxID=5888 RepID=A0CZG0_PARTE|nr:uncharacterized protein GSPATT00011750001 [Paramecium tetraurelia]CAK76177.1 unnamed protein product [Paramecium tetraurelia]|eukprot:XP_001443574.1 hypothetical protein (macronuclear) [Paramecium tetraurelia strain d4-2]